MYAGQYEGLIRSIEKKKKLLQTLKEQLRNAKSKISKKSIDIDVRINKIINGDFGKEIFKIKKIGIRVVKDINFSVNNDVVKDLCYKHYGKKVIISDQSSWETKEILEAYWDQNNIENIFKDSKNTRFDQFTNID